jgi:hypothetical protein
MLVEKGKQAAFHWGLSETLTLALLTGFAYCLVYSFDCGSALEYGVPSSYIVVTPEHLIAVAVIAVYGLFVPVAMIWAHLPDTPNRILGSQALRTVLASTKLKLGVTCIAAMISLPLLIFINGRSPAEFFSTILHPPWALLAGLLTGMSTALLGKLSSRKNVQQPDVEARGDIGGNAIAIRQNTIAAFAFYVWALAYVSLIGATALGVAAGAEKTQVMIVDSGPYKDFAIVWIDGDFDILSKYDAKNHTLGAEMTAVSISRAAPPRWRLVTTGVVRNVQRSW